MKYFATMTLIITLGIVGLCLNRGTEPQSSVPSGSVQQEARPAKEPGLASPSDVDSQIENLTAEREAFEADIQESERKINHLGDRVKSLLEGMKKLEQLDSDYDQNLISDQAYIESRSMILNEIKRLSEI